MVDSDSTEKTVREAQPGFRWEHVDLLAYKEEGSAPFRGVTRQILFQRSELGCELRYFEIEAGGHSTLERHEHVHAVMILRGSGHCLVGGEIRAVGLHDLVFIPTLTWHQFRATNGEPLGFLCLVNAARDKPQLPTPEEVAEMKKLARVADFLDGARDDAKNPA